MGSINSTEKAIKAALQSYEPELNSGCWLWTGPTDSGGYGKICLCGKYKGSHVFFYERLIGHVPDGLFVCHTCDTPLCVNPNHLFLGTHLENMKDRDAKGRSSSSRRHLTYEEIEFIKNSNLIARKIADHIGCSIRTVRNHRNLGIKQHVAEAERGPKHATPDGFDKPIHLGQREEVNHAKKGCDNRKSKETFGNRSHVKMAQVSWHKERKCQ